MRNPNFTPGATEIYVIGFGSFVSSISSSG
jgi:hypothetical protein